MVVAEGDVPATLVAAGMEGVIDTAVAVGVGVAADVAAGVAAAVAAGVAVAVAVTAGVTAGVTTGDAVTPVSARLGEATITGEAAVVTAGTVAAAVAAGVAVTPGVGVGVSVGVSVGVAGRASGDVGTSLAWLAGAVMGEGEVLGLLGAGAGAEGHRPQVAAQ